MGAPTWAWWTGRTRRPHRSPVEIMNHVLGQRKELKAAVADTVVEPALKAALKLCQ